MAKKKTKKTTRNQVSQRSRLSVCRTSLTLGLVLLALAAAAFMGIAVWEWESMSRAAILLWAAAQAVLGYAVLCLYRHQKAARWGAVGVLLLVSAFFSVVPPSTFLSHALQALALTGFSLVLYDLEKFAGVPLRLSGGLIFLGVIGSILSSPLMAFIGLALMALGAGLALTRL